MIIRREITGCYASTARVSLASRIGSERLYRARVKVCGPRPASAEDLRRVCPSHISITRVIRQYLHCDELV